MRDRFIGINLSLGVEKMLVYTSITNDVNSSSFALPFSLFPKLTNTNIRCRDYVGESEFTIGSKVVIYNDFYPFGKDDSICYDLIGKGVADAIEYFNISFLESIYGDSFIFGTSPSDERIFQLDRLGINYNSLDLVSNKRIFMRDKIPSAVYIDNMIASTLARISPEYASVVVNR